MKKLVLLFGVASLLFLSSCDLVMLGNGTIGRETPRIERGMTQEQVYSLLGRPTYRQIAEDGIEEWEYHRSGLLEKRITIIVFAAGRVIRMNTYGEEYGRTDGSHYPRQERRYPRQRDSYPYDHRRYGGYDEYEDDRRQKENERWFNQVYREVQNKFFPDDQLSYIQAIASRNGFTTQQSIQLLRLFDWDEEKLKVLSYVAPRLRDPRNAYRLIDQFTFSDSQQKARQLLGLPD